MAGGWPEALDTMQQPLDYPYPSIFWVDSSASSPWASPGSVFPCPSSVPGRPGQGGYHRHPQHYRHRHPCLHYATTSEEEEGLAGLCLLVVFFMVLVALVGLGLGIFQLFHLQKELAELREVSCLGDCRTLECAEVGRWGETAPAAVGEEGDRNPHGPHLACSILLNPFFPVLEMNHASHPVLPAEK